MTGYFYRKQHLNHNHDIDFLANAPWSYQQLLIEFIQTTHQDALKILAGALFDQKFGESRAINWADTAFPAQVTL